MRRAGYTLMLGLLVFASSCTTTRHATAPVPVREPATPTALVHTLAERLESRDLGAVRELLTDDFVFMTANGDSAGNGGVVTLRGPDFLTFWSALLLGSASNPAPTHAAVTLDRNLVDFPDSRPGMDARVHRMIRSSFDLRLEYEGGRVAEVTGYVLAYATRGDSAVIPPVLIARGFKPDSTRWWLDRYEDETLPRAAAMR